MKPRAIIKVGTRSSTLAVLQASTAVERLAECFPDLSWELVAASSPGDRDQAMDLRVSPPDFFTRDLDDQVRAGTMDCAIHSAKDVPEPIGAGLDWVWLPWREDARDALVRPVGRGMADLPPAGRIGVSSVRREAYCLRRFPGAVLSPVRGTIEQRLRQLDDGAFDLLIMAGAALMRLGLGSRVTEWIPESDLPPPDGQGSLALVFKAGDARFLAMRSLFVRSVTFASAGAGSASACTLESLEALKRCDVCLHDTLFDHTLLRRLPPSVKLIDVGKRAGAHHVPQPETTYRITLYARRGLRVVRLKGGDPGLFGRLAEEVEALDGLAMPYRVLPGVSSLSAATTGTGMLLTRRGVSRGFTVMTPRVGGGGIASIAAEERLKLPMVLFMATGVAGEVTRELLAEGKAPSTPAAVVYGAGSDQVRILKATLATLADRIQAEGCGMAGLILVGEAIDSRATPSGALAGRRILLTASEALQEKAAGAVRDAGGIPVCRPLIRLVPADGAMVWIRQLDRFDWVVLTSPSAVRCFGELVHRADVDFRSVPKLVSCGGGTSRELARLGFKADLEPMAGFGGDGLLNCVRAHVKPGLRILRLRSDKAGPGLAHALEAMGAVVEDCLLYTNEPVMQAERPDFDDVLFASASAVEAFAQLWGMPALEGKGMVAIGEPTLAALRARGVRSGLVPPEATVESSIETLARHQVARAVLHAIDLKETL